MEEKELEAIQARLHLHAMDIRQGLSVLMQAHQTVSHDCTHLAEQSGDMNLSFALSTAYNPSIAAVKRMIRG